MPNLIKNNADARVLIALLLILIGQVPSLSHASVARGDWIESTGEAVADDIRPLNEVKQEALNKARAHAIEQAVGIKVQGETLVRDFALQSDFVASLSAGTILEEKVIRWQSEILNKDDGSAPVLIYRVYLKAKVAIESGNEDPAFKIRASVNRTVFKNNDDVVLKIKSTKDCYVTIFVVTEHNQVFLVYPNKYKKTQLMKQDEEFTYPSDRDVARGLTLKAGLLPGSQKTKEMFRVIATRKPINFTPDIFAEGVGLEAYKKETATLKELVRELVTIPLNERTEAFVTYEIVK